MAVPTAIRDFNLQGIFKSLPNIKAVTKAVSKVKNIT
jgi:hypothetical protein